MNPLKISLQISIVDWNKSTHEERLSALKRPVSDRDVVFSEKVTKIIEKIKSGGDQSLIELTQLYDQVQISELRVSEKELREAEGKVSKELVSALKVAIKNIRCFHEAQVPKNIDLETAPGVRCERRALPIQRVGLYIPGGTAPLPSTVLMLGVPSQIAGCKLRVLVTPPQNDGSIDPTVLVAAQLLGIKEIYKAGGAQAIAALAYGTKTIPKVDKIFGPGNSWVTEAKLQVAQDPSGASCDLPAGPSEVLVIADDSANASFVAADLLAQAEHGSDSQVVLVTTSASLLDAVLNELNSQLELLPRKEMVKKALSKSVLIQVSTLSEAMDVANEYAPEHLILQVQNARKLANDVQNAGSVFIGAWTPESVGDYASGTNHVLPTYGFARTYSGLSTESFMKTISFQELSSEGLKSLGPVVERLATAEHLQAHKNAITLRLEQL